MTSKNKLVYIVEDEPDTSALFAELLRIEGFNVKQAFGGTAAIDMVAKERPHAVLLDMMMPDVSGIEVLKYIRRDPMLENVPVVVVSGRPMPDEIQIEVENGATVFVLKPIGLAQLMKAMEEAVAKSGHHS